MTLSRRAPTASIYTRILISSYITHIKTASLCMNKGPTLMFLSTLLRLRLVPREASATCHSSTWHDCRRYLGLSHPLLLDAVQLSLSEALLPPAPMRSATSLSKSAIMPSSACNQTEFITVSHLLYLCGHKNRPSCRIAVLRMLYHKYVAGSTYSYAKYL